MKRNFSAPILDLDGQPVRIGASVDALTKALQAVTNMLPADQQAAALEKINAELEKPLTLASVCTGALLNVELDDKGLSDDERIARMELARRLHVGGVLDIEPKDRDRVKPLIKKRFGGVLVPVVAWELLEQDVEADETTS